MNSYTYEQAVEYLYKIPAFAGKNSFENTKEFLHELGEYEKMKNVIHVAGTNGKGSVCSYVQSVLLKAGYNVGLFTSPHLVSINERIRINGKEVENNIFLRAFIRVKETVDDRIKRGCTHPAFFEFVFAMACIIFENSKLDFIILETGLGGRLDATNIVEQPLVTAITAIGLDHTQYLGETLEEIAEEKAGIIKNNVPVIFDADKSCVKDVILKKATTKGADTVPVFEENVKNIKISEKNIDFLVEYGYDNSVCIDLVTNAIYQIKNVNIAIEIIHTLNSKIDGSIIKEGIEAATWRGRMEWIEQDFLLDGAHNTACIERVIDSIKAINKNVLLLFSAVADKKYQLMIKELCSRLPVKEIIITELNINRGVSAEELESLFKIHFNGHIYIEREVTEAIVLAKKHLKEYENAFVFATGSLYLVSEIIAAYES